MKRLTLIICICLITSLVFGSLAFAGDLEDVTGVIIEETEVTEETGEVEEGLSETILAEMEIFNAIDYSNGNLLTEEEFYSILNQVLALHGLELTNVPNTSAYFYFNYDNVENVRLLTVAKTEEELQEDTEAAWASFYGEVEEYAKKKAALKGNDSLSNEEEEEAEEEAEEEEASFDLNKDVLNSQDYVASFVLTSTGEEMDQQILFLVSAIVWCIMNPHYNNTDAAFYYLWRALYTIYGNSEGLAASTIDGIDSEYPFSIPGNATEAWFGKEENGDYMLIITNYAVFDEIIDISNPTNMDLANAVSALFGN